MLSIAESEETHVCWIRHHRAMKEYKRLKSEKRMWPMEIITLVGETGTGKTKWAYDNYPALYSLDHAKQSGCYFDDYDDHDVVLIDEMYGNRFSHGMLLRLTDWQPMKVPIHGGFVNFRPSVIIFCSNSYPSEWYDAEKFVWNLGPLQRRLTTQGSRIYAVEPGGVLVLVEGDEPLVFGPENVPGE